MKKMFSNEVKSIPLSFVINNQYINSIPIGMLSKKSIKRNILIEQNPIDNEITEAVAKWCLNKCQISD